MKDGWYWWNPGNFTGAMKAVVRCFVPASKWFPPFSDKGGKGELADNLRQATIMDRHRMTLATLFRASDGQVIKKGKIPDSLKGCIVEVVFRE